MNDENGGRVFTLWGVEYPVMKRTALVAGFAVALALFAAAAVGGATGSGTQANATANASFGAEVSSFMQASSAEAAGEVDDGMFAAALNRTEDPEERRRIIEERTAALETREERLRARQRALNDSGPIERYAIATEVSVRAAELEESANRTQRAAAAAGLNTTALAELRANASDMHGRVVAEIAGGIAGPTIGDGGPPSDVPGVAGNGSAPNGTNAAPGNGSAAPGNRGPESSEGARDGPPANDTGASGNDPGTNEAQSEDD